MTQRIEIVPYNPEWPGMFEQERDRLRAALGPLARRIEHNGSTAVPGLAAKPIIDIQISVEQLSPLDAFTLPLAAIGYTHVPHPDDSFCPFLHRPKGWPHTHHVHVVEADGDEERRTLAFRDYLRDHDDVARAYAALKHRLARQHDAGDFASRQAYAEAKSDFITNVIAQALDAGYTVRS